jgi:hypothetical protein
LVSGIAMDDAVAVLSSVGNLDRAKRLLDREAA